mmetsp:Transcript_51998/g.118497  ORF Transcript_51998/g.118497 Transcript_51998/m.118497 type:complete len:250 (+) Transcript_51998:428-1177(+)
MPLKPCRLLSNLKFSTEKLRHLLGGLEGLVCFLPLGRKLPLRFLRLVLRLVELRSLELELLLERRDLFPGRPLELFNLGLVAHCVVGKLGSMAFARKLQHLRHLLEPVLVVRFDGLLFSLRLLANLAHSFRHGLGALFFGVISREIRGLRTRGRMRCLDVAEAPLVGFLEPLQRVEHLLFVHVSDLPFFCHGAHPSAIKPGRIRSCFDQLGLNLLRSERLPRPLRIAQILCTERGRPPTGTGTISRVPL